MPELESEEPTEGFGAGRRMYVIKTAMASTPHLSQGPRKSTNATSVPWPSVLSALTHPFLRLIPEAPDGV